MKKILAIFSIIIFISSCTKLEDLNDNVKDPTTVTGESLFTSGQKAFFDQMVSTNVNLNIFRLIVQYWTETTYIDESNYDLVTRTIPDNHWDALYRDVLKDFKESYGIIKSTNYVGEDPQIKKNRLAVVEVMQVYTYCVLVETFGDVPYTEALSLDHLLPKYDDAETIYRDLISRLNTAINDMDPAFGSLGSADNMYGGNTASWVKFANSLKLRMGLMMADVDATLAKTTVEAAAPHVFGSNADNGSIPYLRDIPNTNPIYEDLVASGRHDFIPANTIVDTMNARTDPRRPYYFTLYEGDYVGGPNGEGGLFSDYSHVADAIQEPTFEGTILDYAEVEFLLAEACERGFAVGGTAKSHYDAAVTASIVYWGGTPAEATAYLALPNVGYNTQTGTWKEKIGVQKWIALYNRGFEAWTEWRKFDFPNLQHPPDAVFEYVPVRYTYPIAEQTLNGSNYQAASAHIGGDACDTKLFWDKN